MLFHMLFMNIMENTAFPHDWQLRNVTSINPSSHFLTIYKRKVHELSVSLYGSLWFLDTRRRWVGGFGGRGRSDSVSQCCSHTGQSVGRMMWLLSCQSNNGQVTLHLIRTSRMPSQTYTLRSNTHTQRERKLCWRVLVCHQVSLTPLTVIPVIISSSDRKTDSGSWKKGVRQIGGYTNNKFGMLLCRCTLGVCYLYISIFTIPGKAWNGTCLRHKVLKQAVQTRLITVSSEGSFWRQNEPCYTWLDKHAAQWAVTSLASKYEMGKNNFNHFSITFKVSGSCSCENGASSRLATEVVREFKEEMNNRVRANKVS